MLLCHRAPGDLEGMGGGFPHLYATDRPMGVPRTAPQVRHGCATGAPLATPRTVPHIHRAMDRAMDRAVECCDIITLFLLRSRIV